MAERPLISAIIPTRNRAVLLPRALDSVYAQEGIGEQFDLEVVIVDDASADATPDVVTQYPRARYIRLSTPRGASGARNAGIAVSRGALIAFLDDDDLGYLTVCVSNWKLGSAIRRLEPSTVSSPSLRLAASGRPPILPPQGGSSPICWRRTSWPCHRCLFAASRWNGWGISTRA